MSIWAALAAMFGTSCLAQTLASAAVTLHASQTVTVTATSLADAAKSAVAVVDLNPALRVNAAATTPTQAILSYTAPNIRACAVAVSLSSDFSTPVPDTDPALFSNLDNRPGSVSIGLQRLLVVGKRSADVGLDQRRYSRTLEPNTTYYYRVQCGASQATGTFRTQNLPFGNTYPDPAVSDLGSPGAYSWPTIDGLTGKTTDPQTGVAMYPFGFGTPWTSGARTIMCGLSTKMDATGKSGFPCRPGVNGDFYWIDVEDGIIRDIGTPGYVYENLSGDQICCSAAISSNSSPFSGLFNSFFAVAPTSASKYVLLKGAYTGQWATGDIGSYLGIQTNIAWSNLTPANTGHDVMTLMHNFDPTFDPALFTYVGPSMIGLTGDESKVILLFSEGSQGSIGWIGVFDPAATSCGASACPVAALPLWKSAQTRWCPWHSENAAEGSSQWITLEPAFNGYTDVWNGDDGVHSGDGPWVVTLNAGLSASPQYAAGTNLATQGFPGVICGPNGCDIRTVSGQPCDPTPGNVEFGLHNCTWNSRYYYLMDAVVGDIVQLPDAAQGLTNEPMKIIGINGLSWALQRAAFPGYRAEDHGSITTLGMVCATNFSADTVGWNFAGDPHGSGTNPASVIADATDGTSHSTFANTNGAGQATNCLSGENNNCTAVKTGKSPGAYLNQPATVKVASFPSFAGNSPANTVNIIESYTASGPAAPTVANPNFVVQARLMETGNFNTWTSLGGDIYHLTVNRGTYTPKDSSLVAACQGLPLKDASSPAKSGSGPVPSLTTPYTYCYAKASGECYAGATAGQMYAHCPAFDGDASHNFIVPASQQLQKISQLRWDDPNTLGRDARPITTSFRAYNRYSSFWSARAVPDGSALLTYCDACGPAGNSSVFLVKLPPTVAWDGIDRTTFIPVTLNIPAGPREAASALVKFGYAENGSPTDFNCTSRRDVCYAASATLDPAAPFLWRSESPRGVACSSGCNIQIPGISGRVLYYQVEYRNRSNQVLGDGQTYATTVP